ncbi:MULTISPECIES: hypothetical protein [Streptomyces]|uniref:C2H2-type domain-containing protein n=1 Tax=Streptomyces sudanensis TaxID=436397 RepID=A0ABY4TBV7_9ACTN|nr:MULTISPECIES: hypothetical protein [Streptomyces]MCP9958635.1 hypothetical protein [Streptomyces sudanensis]MCQ0000866.1 hypothetical protein [Streptomyces sudanensis]URN16443.1 hypothetical protein MW084_11410 [Streptomyces sudanensis]
MSETPGAPVGHEAYAFTCMRCGYGWEQEYDIEHHADVDGQDFVVYRSEGRRVPSPLSKPTCPNCGRNVVRIMGSGRISVVLDHGEPHPEGSGATLRRAAPVSATGPIGQELEERTPRDTDTVSSPEAKRSGATRLGGGEPHRLRLPHLFHRD